MAHVIAHDLQRIDLSVRREELTFEDSSLDPRVRDRFLARGFDRRATEADLGCCYVQLSLDDGDGSDGTGQRLRGELAPFSFYLKLAYMDLVADNGGEPIDDLPSPRLANVGLLVPLLYRDRPYLLGQIKGRALDRGQLLLVGAAGKVDAPALFGQAPPLIATLEREVDEELGVPLAQLDCGPFYYLIDEPENGNINHSCVARSATLELIFEQFGRLVEARLAEHGDPAQLEVSGLALVPLDLVHGPPVLHDILTFVPEGGELAAQRRDLQATAYTWAMLEHLARPEHRDLLLDRACL